MIRNRTLALATLTTLALAPAALASDLYIKVLAATCMNCHGPGGKSTGAVPSLAGQDPSYLQTAMLEQRAGTRETTVMRRYMNGYTNDEIVQLAKYFADLK